MYRWIKHAAVTRDAFTCTNLIGDDQIYCALNEVNFFHFFSILTNY